MFPTQTFWHYEPNNSDPPTLEMLTKCDGSLGNSQDKPVTCSTYHETVSRW